MTNATVTERVRKIEAEVRLLKNAVARRPDMLVDEKNWKKIKPFAKKVRAVLYKERYA